jgi:beta-xylosidase
MTTSEFFTRRFLRPVLFFSFTVLLLSCRAKDRDCIRPGEIWPDNNGVHINAHGGGMLYHRGQYYWFGEDKSERSNAALKGVRCYSSKDLCHWKDEGIVLAVVEDEPAHELTKGCIIERPKVVYNKKTGTFVMWFHHELRWRGYSAARVGLAVSDKVTGPYRFIHSYRPNPGIWPENMSEEDKSLDMEEASRLESWTPEWLEAVRKGFFVIRDFEGGQMSRDMTVFVDDDGKAYHIYSSEENLTLHIAELSDDYQSHTGKYIRIIPAGHNEAPAIFKKDGRYFMITSGCTGWRPNAARLLTATSIWGPWEQKPNPWQGEQADISFDSQSTFIFPLAGKKDAFVFMADRWRPRNPSDGRYIWLPLEFEDGLPVLRWRDSWSPAKAFKK